MRSIACLALYAVIVLVTICFHEPWADEAHSWQLARENGWLALQWQWLRYEGSPGLWHTLLWLPSHLGLPYEASIKTIAVVCAVAGVAAFLRFSPLPLWLTLPLPFTFFVVYQYGVVARSYCLLLLTMSLAAAFLPQWHRLPIRFAATLLALSMISLHGAIIAMGFGAQALLDAYDRRRERSDWKPARMAAAIGLVALGWLVLVLQLIPPADLNFAATVRLDPLELAMRVVAYAGRWMVGFSAPSPVIIAGFLLSLALFVWSAWRRVVFGPLCLVALTALAGLKHAVAWHDGVLFLVWVFTLWLIWARTTVPTKWQQRVAGLTAAILAVHIGYAATTIALDLRGTYSASRDVAEHLKRNLKPGEVLWGYDFMTIAVQPYFTQPLFANQAAVTDGKAAWLWSQRNRAAYPIEQAALCAGKPDLVLTVRETIEPGKPNTAALEACGYVLEKSFSGALFFQGGPVNSVDYLLYRRRR